MANELERENRELRQANEILLKGDPVKAPLVRAHWRTRILLRRSSTARLRIPEHPATHSDHIRPPVPTHSATYDALP